MSTQPTDHQTAVNRDQCCPICPRSVFADDRSCLCDCHKPAELVTLGKKIARLLRGYRFPVVDEYDLQAEVEQVLLGSHWTDQISREPRLSTRDRPDFIVDDVGVELKVDGPTAAVTRQLRRYASHPRIHELVLVTTRARHGQITDVGCPLHIVVLPGVT